MSYNIENINDCTKKIEFNFANPNIDSEIRGILLQKQKESNIKGFRKGRAPMHLIEQMYGVQAKSDAINQFINKEITDAIRQENLEVINLMPLENMKYEQGQSISFDAIVEVFPKIEVKDFSGLSFTKKAVTVDDKEVDDLIKQQYLEKEAETREVEGDDVELRSGHLSVINFEGEKDDGTRPDAMKGSEFLLEIGSNQFIPGFEDGMIGMKKGDTRTIPLTFPADYQEESLQNSKVDFEVELLEIKEKIYQTLDDEFATKHGYKDLADMKASAKENIISQKEGMNRNQLQEDIMSAITEQYEFTTPVVMVDREKEEIKKEIRSNLLQQNYSDTMVNEYFDKWEDDLNKRAARQVKSRLIFQTLLGHYKISIAEEEVDAKIVSMTGAGPEDTPENAKLREMYLSNEKIRESIKASLLAEKMFSRLYEEVKIVEE